MRKQIVPAIHRGLLRDPQHLDTLKPAIFQSLLAQRDLIREVPEEVGAALRRMVGRHLLWHPGRLWPRGRRDLSILRAEYGVVGFHPQRDDWLKQIFGWCESDRRIAIRLVTGPGGTGKTRLMLEVCDRLPRSWRAGFLHPETPAVPSWELDGLIDGEQPLLLVVDYAEEERTRTALGAILKYLRLHWSGHPVRLMLLTREESDWWPKLAGSDAEVHDLVSEFPPTVDELPPLAVRVEQRQEALRAAARAYARALDVPEPDVARVDVAADYLAQALYLHLAALAATEGEFPHGEQDLLNWVIEREKRFWRKGLEDFELAQAIDADAIRQALALATLAGGADRAEIGPLLQRAPLLADVGINVRKRVGELLHQLYPGQRYLEPLRPDVVGEHLVDQALTSEPDLLVPALQNDRKHTLIVLSRLAMRRPEAEEWLKRAIDTLREPVEVLRGMLASADYRLFDERVETILRYHMERLQKGEHDR